jgi:hypothetical protein
VLWFSFIVMGPVVAGLGLALVWWLIRGRALGLSGRGSARFSLAVGVTLLTVAVVAQLMDGPLPLLLDVPPAVWNWYADNRFAIPLWLGILGLVMLIFPVQARNGHGAADLTPRTVVSFARGWWFVTPAVVGAFILILTFAAGPVSVSEEEPGRFDMYYVDLGGGRGMGTSIYGWFYSVPALILTGLLIAIAVLNLVLISRPALDRDRERDLRNRTMRTRNVLLVGTGALLVHLGLILGSLAGTASIRSSFPTPDGTVTFWTTFAALQPVFTGASNVALMLGFALWAVVALSAVPSRLPAPVDVRS